MAMPGLIAVAGVRAWEVVADSGEAEGEAVDTAASAAVAGAEGEADANDSKKGRTQEGSV